MTNPKWTLLLFYGSEFHRYDNAQRSDQTTHISDAQLWRSNALEGRTKCQISSAKRRAFLFNFTV